MDPKRRFKSCRPRKRQKLSWENSGKTSEPVIPAAKSCAVMKAGVPSGGRKRAEDRSALKKSPAADSQHKSFRCGEGARYFGESAPAMSRGGREFNSRLFGG